MTTKLISRGSRNLDKLHMDLRAMMIEMKDLVPVDFRESQIAEAHINEAGKVVMALFVSSPFWYQESIGRINCIYATCLVNILNTFS